MFQAARWKRFAALLVFFAGYTLLFFLWVKTFFYSLPFVAGFLVALILQPLARWLQKRFRLRQGVAAGSPRLWRWWYFAADWHFWG